MPADGYVVALDIGTSALRALLFDTRAQPVPGVDIRIPHMPKVAADGTHETDGDVLFRKLTRLIDGLLLAAGPRRRTKIRAVGVSTFWHGLIACDDLGHALTPVYLWADTRAWRQASELRHNVDVDSVHQRTGCLIHPSYWPSKLAWLRQDQADLWRRRPRFLSFWDMVNQTFFGRPVTGVSMASGTGLLDLRRCTWDAGLLRILDVEEEQLCELGEVGEGLLRRYAVRWPDLKDVPWVCAAGDGALANLGSNCVDATQRALTVGTSGALRVLYPGLPERIPEGLWCYRLDRRRAVVGGSLSNGGNLYAWMTRTLAVEKDSLEKDLRRMRPAASGLTFVPLLAGERSPGFALHATGAIAGLTQATTSLDIIHAGLEATAIEFSGINKRLDTILPRARQVVANGAGLLASAAWMQIMADAIGSPIAESRTKEASARGAAMMALEHIGVLNGAGSKPDVRRTYQPRPEARGVYVVQTAKQEELYRALISDGRPD